MRDTLRLSPRGRGRLAIVLIAGLALSAATGCDGDDASSQALRNAEIKLRAMMPAREQVPGDEMTKAYNDVIGSLTEVSQSGSPAQRAAAAGIIAQAHAGLAQGPAEEAMQIEQETINAILQLRSLHTKFMTLSAMAQAAAAFDPQAEVAEIEKQSAERDQELQRLTKRKADIDAQVQRLRGEAEALLAQARGKREEAATIKGGVANETATRGEELMRQAHSLTREADQLEVRAADLEAQAAKIEPDSAQAQLDIDRVNEQKQLLAAAREAVLKRAQASRAEAAEARQQAQQVADEMIALVNQVEGRRTGELAKAHEEAARHLETAISSAGQSVSAGAQKAGKMATGAHNQARGDLAWARAQGHAAWASALEAIAQAQPSIPQAAEYKAKADAARAASKAMLETATESYKAADQAYQASGAGEADVQQQIDRINALLAEAVKITSEGSEDIRVASAPVDAGGEAAEPTGADPAAGGETPIDTLRTLQALQESGDTEGMRQYFLANNQAEQQLLDAMLQLVAPSNRLRAALISKFGPDGEAAIEAVSGEPGMGSMLDTGFEKELEADWQVDGDIATANVGENQITMQRVDGVWKFDLSSMTAQLPPEAFSMMSTIIPAIGGAVGNLASEIEAGKYNSAQEAMAVLEQKLMESMMKAMQNNGG